MWSHDINNQCNSTTMKNKSKMVTDCRSFCLSVTVNVFVFVSVCLSVCLSACVCLSICLSVSLSVCLSVCLAGWLPVSVCLPVPICLSVCLRYSISIPHNHTNLTNMHEWTPPPPHPTPNETWVSYTKVNWISLVHCPFSGYPKENNQLPQL